MCVGGDLQNKVLADIKQLVCMHFQIYLYVKRFCYNLFTIKLFQTCMSFFLLLNTKYYILKNVGKQTVAGSHCLP